MIGAWSAARYRPRASWSKPMRKRHCHLTMATPVPLLSRRGAQGLPPGLGARGDHDHERTRLKRVQILTFEKYRFIRFIYVIINDSGASRD